MHRRLVRITVLAAASTAGLALLAGPASATTGLGFSIGNASILEGNAGTKPMTFTITLSGASDTVVSVHWATTFVTNGGGGMLYQAADIAMARPSGTVGSELRTSTGSATAGSDYIAASGTATFAPGQTTQTISVQIIGDTVPEPNELFGVLLSAPSTGEYIILVNKEGGGTIMNDDGRVGALLPTRHHHKKHHHKKHH
jgi:hypothetical protein